MITIYVDILKLRKFILDLLEYNASLIWNLVPFGSIMFALLEPLIKFAVLDMTHTLTFVNVKSRKYLLSRRIMCVVAQSARHTLPLFILRSITHEFLIQLKKIINNNVIDIITKGYFI